MSDPIKERLEMGMSRTELNKLFGKAAVDKSLGATKKAAPKKKAGKK